MHLHDERRRTICNRVDFWAQRLSVHPRLVRVQKMTRKWGSCSNTGIITLAIDLADQEPGFQDFVIAHELLHLRVPNHGKLFNSLMSVHVPDWKERNLQR
ncbi:MAG: M48 family metallopeptidase [Caldilineaceae bacterium]|nr:M48 family metallopeptidase [Caldilineaceae bacterium]